MSCVTPTQNNTRINIQCDASAKNMWSEVHLRSNDSVRCLLMVRTAMVNALDAENLIS